MMPPPHTHFVYVECDVPEGASLTEWRRQDTERCEQRPDGAMRRLLRRMRRLGRPSA